MLTGVRLQNFRSYDDQTFEFSRGVNIVVGPNASGKTNLLEALYVCARGQSFRANDADIIMRGQPWARIDVETDKNKRAVKIKAANPIQKQFIIGADNKRRLSVEKRLPVVLFEPDDLRLLGGSPARRRRYLDQLTGQLNPEKGKIIGRYKRALLQRNALLKYSNSDNDELFVWNVKLGELGWQIAQWRLELIEQLNQSSGRIYSRLAGRKHQVKFEYLPSIDGNYQQKFHKHLASGVDIKTGFTSVGPHRDDFLVKIDDEPSSRVASRGETRTLVLVAKLTELSLVEAGARQKPLLLLDDVFSELDGKRRKKLSDYLRDYQTLITTTDADAVLEHFLKRDINIIPLI